MPDRKCARPRKGTGPGRHACQRNERGSLDETGYTIGSAFLDTTSYFAPGDQLFMINFRVSNLEELVAALREAGVEIVGGVEQHPNRTFAWMLDPEGRKVELWEPVPSREDPHLRPAPGDAAPDSVP